LGSRKSRRGQPTGPARVAGEQGRRKHEIKLKPAAKRAVKKLEEDHLKRVAARIDGLATDLRPRDAEKLRGRKEVWRVRTGDYRILYTIRDKILLITVIQLGQRRDVYR